MINLRDYDYGLPEGMIAQKSHRPRDGCRLMIIKDKILHKKFSDVLDFLHDGDVLVLNNTRVMKMKIYGKKSTGSDAEIVLTRKLYANTYECHIKTRNPHAGTVIELSKGKAMIIKQKDIDTYIIKIAGHSRRYMPGPPYIKKKMTSEYQTVYAKLPGSLASPTAGLHFTNNLLKKIRDKGVKIAHITLHIGYGTFRNIDDIKSYRTEKECFEITRKASETINKRKGRLFVAGTTTLKALESSSRDGKIIPKKSSSRLFIKPGHRFSCGADALITNFHLPKSSLLLLTCAFGGRKRVLDAYQKAIEKKYRFYSLGDAMIIYKFRLQKKIYK